MMELVREDIEDDTIADFTSQISGKLGSPIAIGSFGEVYRCTIEFSTGKMEVAVKVFKIDARRAMIPTQNDEKRIRRELKVWLKLQHSSIVPLLGIASVEPTSPSPALVSKWMSSGTLYAYLEKNAEISTSIKLKLIKGVTDGLNYLHSKHVVHGDLHPGNVLIDGSGNPCLTDFGFATVVGDSELQLTTMTAEYSFNSRWRAPEVIGIEHDPRRPTFKSDVYSCGSVIFFIVSGDIPWKGKKQSHQVCIELSKRTTPTRPKNIPDWTWNLIQECWSWEPEHRPESAEVFHSAINHRTMSMGNIVIFGEIGAGKSSVINLMAGRQIATISPDSHRCTMHWTEYTITFDNETQYQVFDTVGLEDPLIQHQEYLSAITNAYSLINALKERGGINLLLFCIRGGRVTETMQSNYRLFFEFLCEEKVPLVLVVTNLEREKRMEDWYTRNSIHLEKHNIRSVGHACITAATALDGRHKDKYEESREIVCSVVQAHCSALMDGWSGGQGWFTSLVSKIMGFVTGRPKTADVIGILTRRCGMDKEVAQKMAQQIRSENYP